METETETFFAADNPTRSEHPLADGWHYRRRAFDARRGQWSEWIPSQEAWDTEEEALSAAAQREEQR